MPCRFEKIELSNNFFWVSSEGLYGIYNRYGSTIIPCRYNQIELTDRCFYVCRDRLKGVYNRYGSVIIPCQFSQIECKDNAYYVTKGKYQGILQQQAYDDTEDIGDVLFNAGKALEQMQQDLIGQSESQSFKDPDVKEGRALAAHVKGVEELAQGEGGDDVPPEAQNCKCDPSHGHLPG